MTRISIIRFLPASIVGLLICYAVTCNAQIPTSREDEEAIRKVIAGTTEAFNKPMQKPSRVFIPRMLNWSLYAGNG